MAHISDCYGCDMQASQQLGQAPEAAGAVTTYEAETGHTVTRSIGLGVVTGVLVWFVTRFLDGRFTRRRS